VRAQIVIEAAVRISQAGADGALMMIRLIGPSDWSV
jgi:hypothetical protein